MSNKKKPKFLIGYCLILFLTISMFVGLKYPSTINNLSVDNSLKTSSPDGETFIRAMKNNPTTIDPVDAYDRSSIDVIRQVAETLWFYNWTEPGLPRINMLAESETWINSTALQVTLRQGVLFHDGTPFNASAVKWNIDRMIYLFNHTGAFGSGEDIGDPHSLFEGPDGSPRLVGFEITGTYSGIIHLTQPFTSLMDLFCFSAASMISPTSRAGDTTSFIDLSTGDLVGTGPYMYDSFTPDTEVRFSRWDYYWREPVYFNEMVFEIINDDVARNIAMLNGLVDYLSGIDSAFVDTFKSQPNITFNEANLPDYLISYLVFNNKQINITWRKAMSYAFNYTYVVSDYYQDSVFRAYSPVSQGFGEWYNSSIESVVPYYNKTIARMILSGNDPTPYPVPGIPEAMGRDPLDDGDWGLGANELIAFNYSYNFDHQWRVDLFFLLKTWFDDISINVLNGGTYLEWFFYRSRGDVPGGYDDLQLFWIAWGADYLDPINMIEPLLSNVSKSNGAQANDPWLEAAFVEYHKETDHAKKVEMMHTISNYLVSILYPHLYIYHRRTLTCHSVELFDVPYNMNRYTFYTYPIKPSNYLYVSNPEDITFLVGETGHDIKWNLKGTNLTTPMYYLYKDSTLITNDTWQSGDSISVSLDGLSAGTYNYSIVVYNNSRSVEDSVIVDVWPRLVISHPSDISYTVGDTGNTISWIVSEGNEQNANYYIYDDNNTLIQTNTWEINVSITLDVDRLSVGTHSFRIEVHNSLEYVEDSVQVKVNRKPIPGFPILILIGFISIGIICVGIKLKQKLK
ncbi:MAG: ABC transporter substrate-binding protein [Promethearchaeota archaeon]